MLIRIGRILVCLVAVIILSMISIAGCASPDAARRDAADGEELPWNSPASWENQMPMGSPY